MSKYVKELIKNEMVGRLGSLSEALLVDVIKLDSNSTYLLRKQLRSKNIDIMVVRKSLARLATGEGSALGRALGEFEGSLAIVWGGQDFVSLAKTITELNDDRQAFAKFETRGGVMDGEVLTAERVKEISKWPNREEQLSLLVGQILGPGAKLSAALLGPGAQLASQIKEVEEKASGE
jgi:ribosomal protein L10